MGRVWALDESGSGWGKKARLWVVNAESGQATKLAEWPRLGLFNQHWLTVDRDGSVLLTASSELLRVHAVFRIDTDSQGRLTTTVVRVEKGWLTAAPSVDVAGYGFLVQAKPGVLPVPANVTSLRVDRPQYTSPGSCL